jgi:DNA-binding SARP family transcriptional activator
MIGATAWREAVTPQQATDGETPWPVLICLLGGFRVVLKGRSGAVPSGGKAEALLSTLALRPGQQVLREVLLDSIWPESEAGLACQSLNSVVHSLNKLLRPALAGASPLVYADGSYRLNHEAGVGVDFALFDTVALAGERLARAGDSLGALAAFRHAVELYQGDLSSGAGLQAILERERLRAVYLNLLTRLADDAYASSNFTLCLSYVARLLAGDPCREDAHRLAMRCYVRRGERAQALRQYRLCELALRTEFEAVPDVATTALFDQLRLHPDTV